MIREKPKLKITRFGKQIGRASGNQDGTNDIHNNGKERHAFRWKWAFQKQTSAKCRENADKRQQLTFTKCTSSEKFHSLYSVQNWPCPAKAAVAREALTAPSTYRSFACQASMWSQFRGFSRNSCFAVITLFYMNFERFKSLAIPNSQMQTMDLCCWCGLSPLLFMQTTAPVSLPHMSNLNLKNVLFAPNLSWWRPQLWKHCLCRWQVLKKIFSQQSCIMFSQPAAHDIYVLNVAWFESPEHRFIQTSTQDV